VIRGGYDTRRNYDNKSGMSFGAGINVSNHNLDYAYNINDIVGGTHQISFVFKFGKSRSVKANKNAALTGRKEILGTEIYTRPEEEISAMEVYTVSEDSKSDDREKRYQVCAARYQNKESAQKHIETLKKFGVKSKLYYDGHKEYRIVLGETDDKSKAEKKKANFEKDGIFCFIQEM